MKLVPSRKSILPRRPFELAAAMALVALFGCFGGNGKDHYTRLFRPALPPSEARPAREPNATPIMVRRIYGASHLTESIEWQKGDIEYGYYDELRWIESPARILERELSAELFDARKLQIGSGGDEIEVELLAFEQAQDPALRAVVALEVTRSGKRGNAVRRFEATEPLPDATPESLAHGIGIATRRIIDAAADWIEDPARAPAKKP